MIKKKRCSKCEKLKLEDDFPVRKRGDVVQPDSYCLECRKEVNRLNQERFAPASKNCCDIIDTLEFLTHSDITNTIPSGTSHSTTTESAGLTESAHPLRSGAECGEGH
jgi:endogenous inhibitor of DNA gyrase (YacG/DUF329 family)